MGGPLPSLSFSLSVTAKKNSQRGRDDYSKNILVQFFDYLLEKIILSLSLSLPLWETFREESRYYAQNFLLLLLLHNFSL